MLLKVILKLFEIMNDNSAITYKYFISRQILCCIAMIFFIVSSVIFPGFVGKIIDEMNVSSDYNKIMSKCLLMLAAGLIAVISNYVQKVAFSSLGKDISRGLKELVYKKILIANINFWNENSVGDIVAVIEKDIEVIEIFLSNTAIGILTNFFLAIGLLFYISSINLSFGILLLIIAIIFAFFYNIIGNKVKKNYAELRNSIARFLAFINETINNINGIQMTGYEKIVFKDYKANNDRVIIKSLQQVKLNSLTNSMGIFYNVLSVFIVLSFGTIQNSNGLISAGNIFNLVLYTQRLYSPILTVTANYLECKKIIPVLNKLISVLENNDIITSGSYYTDKLQEGYVVFDQVCFQYDKNKTVFKDLNIIINKDDIIGIVGNNGTGKSTLMKLLTKTCKTCGGSIYIDNVNIDDFEISCLRNNIGCMPQNYNFMSGKLRKILDPFCRYEDEDIICVCNDFMLDIRKFHEGLDTLIGENKVNLSGGEAQKISLIRLILENKIINFMDEPTSEMDMESEKQICNSLPKYLLGKTTLIITHRKEILKICNKTLEL